MNATVAVFRPEGLATPSSNPAPDHPPQAAPWRIHRLCVARFILASTDPDTPAHHGEDDRVFWRLEGDLFDAAGCRFDPATAAALALRNPTALTRSAWGTYWLSACDKTTGRCVVLADPCGQFPLFYRVDARGSLHVAPDIEALVALAGQPAQPDPAHIHAWLAHGGAAPGSTAWEGLHALPPGHALVREPGSTARVILAWDPCIDTVPGAPADIHAALCGVLHAMLGNREAVLDLSGGLDSSAIAVALHACGLAPRVRALTRVDTTRDAGDEGNAAAAVARHCGMQHMRYDLRHRLPFTPTHRIRRCARPATALAFLAQLDDLARRGLPGPGRPLINGHGGDALFLALPPHACVIDALARLRLRRAASALRDLAVFHRTSLWQAASSAARAVLAQRGRGDRLAAAPGRAVHPMPGQRHGAFDPLLRRWRLLAQPAKRLQIAQLGATLDETMVHFGLDSRRPLLPFLAQPVVELALRCRPEDLFSGFHARLPLREAMHRIAPLDNFWRRDKGDTTHTMLEGLLRNEAHVRALCLEGRCVDMGLIDRQALETLIRRGVLGDGHGLAEIVRVYTAEVFLLAQQCHAPMRAD